MLSSCFDVVVSRIVKEMVAKIMGDAGALYKASEAVRVALFCSAHLPIIRPDRIA